MYMVIRRFSHMRSVAQAARRAETGLGQILKRSPGFLGYYVFDAGEGVGGSVTLFNTREAAIEANDKAVAWIQASLADLIDGEPEITAGAVLCAITAEADHEPFFMPDGAALKFPPLSPR